MEKWLIKALGLSLLSLLLFASNTTLGNYEVKASQKRIYHSETTTPNGVQQLLNQRASEGWRLVAVSEGNQDGNSVLVVVFDREQRKGVAAWLYPSAEARGQFLSFGEWMGYDTPSFYYPSHGTRVQGTPNLCPPAWVSEAKAAAKHTK